MGELIPMPKRCAYLGCRKVIRADQGQTSVVHDGKHYHGGCFAKVSGPNPPDGGGVAMQAEKAFRKRMAKAA